MSAETGAGVNLDKEARVGIVSEELGGRCLTVEREEDTAQ